MKQRASLDISAMKNKMSDKKRDICSYMMSPSVLNIPTWLAKNLNLFLSYTDVLSRRVQTKLRVRLRFRKLRQRLEKKMSRRAERNGDSRHYDAQLRGVSLRSSC